MNVGQLRQLIQDLPDDTDIAIRTPDSRPGYYQRNPPIGVTYDNEQFIIDVEPDEEQQSLPPQ